MEYVVIGSSGFIGAGLMRSLDAIGVDRQIVDLKDAEAAKALGPIVDGKACIFCASVPPKRTGWDESENLRILEPFLSVASQCAHVTYLSSDMVYPYDTSVSEETPADPDSVYGKIHLTREKALSDIVGQRLLIARLSQVYGPGDTHNAYGPCRMLREALLGGPIIVKGRGEERRDHIRIEDVVSVLNSLVKKNCTGVFNIATGRSVTFEYVAKSVQTIVPSEIQFEPRTVPIKHRDFDIAKLQGSVPDFKPQAMYLNDMIDMING